MAAKSRHSSTHRTTVQETIPQANIHQLHAQVSAEFLDVNPRSCVERNMPFGPSYGFLFHRKENLPPSSSARTHHCPTVYILSFGFVIGVGLHVFASSTVEKLVHPLFCARLLHCCRFLLWSVHAFASVSVILRTLSNLHSHPSNRESFDFFCSINVLVQRYAWDALIGSKRLSCSGPTNVFFF